MHKKSTVNVIMPVYNEEKTAYGIIKRVLRQKMVDRLIIVYRVSNDDTLNEIKRAIKGCKKCEIIKKGFTKGYSLKLGLKKVKNGIVIIQDADEEYYPEDYGRLLDAISDSSPVFGYRTVNFGHGYPLGIFANKVHTAMFNLLFGQSVKDINTCYMVFKIEMLKGATLKQDGWEINEEIAAVLAKKGYRIKNVPIRYKGRKYSEGKKIGARAAVDNLLFIIKSRFVS
jgi:glycosyltransferase involved in cell wall biosynthesis